MTGAGASVDEDNDGDGIEGEWPRPSWASTCSELPWVPGVLSDRGVEARTSEVELVQVKRESRRRRVGETWVWSGWLAGLGDLGWAGLVTRMGSVFLSGCH
jgi:hypothetical protein